MRQDTFADRMRELREARGLTQYALAKMTGLSKQAVNKLEQGDREPAWQTVQLLAKAFGVDCTVFQDETLELPAEEPSGKPGRPRKAAEPDQADEPKAKKPRKGKVQPAEETPSKAAGVARGKRSATGQIEGTANKPEPKKGTRKRKEG